ncbi:YD repeat-containing protein, partial [Vreelandella songnenensis]
DNRLGQLNGTRYRYDGAGNMIERQQPNGERLTMGYDGANRLVSLTRTATTHYGLYGDRIVREESDSQRTTVVYEPGSFVPMLRLDGIENGQALSAFVTDVLCTSMLLALIKSA